MLRITKKAKEKIQQLRIENEYDENCCIRVSVKGGGCSGLMYNLSFNTQISENDKIYKDEDIKVIIDKKSLLYLMGITLDYSDRLNGKGFHFINPNATRTCGCGESFAV